MPPADLSERRDVEADCFVDEMTWKIHEFMTVFRNLEISQLLSLYFGGKEVVLRNKGERRTCKNGSRLLESQCSGLQLRRRTKL